MERRTFRAVAARERELTHLREAEKIGYHGFAAPVLVRAVGMQPVAAAPVSEIDQGQREIVAAEEPGECTRRLGFPRGIAIGTPCRKAGRDRRRGLQGLLIERPRRLALVAESCVPTGRKKPAGVVCSVMSQRKDLKPAAT